MSSETVSSQGSYLKQIDALRAVAVTMVVFSHWAGYHQNLWNDDIYWFNGEVGVQLFFTISGFLITGILLDERRKAESIGMQKSGVLQAFYIRRFLRIFPLFYATLAVTWMLGHPDVRQSVQYHLAYLSNFYFAWRGDYLGDVSHFWSLAVEEQFYFVWPFVILFLPKRLLLPFIVSCLCIAPLFRYVVEFMFHANDVVVNVLPVSSLDSLAGGALLAILMRPGFINIDPGVSKWVGWGSLAAGLCYIALRSFLSLPGEFEPYILFLSRALLIPSLYGVVLICSRGVGGMAGAILESAPLSFLGRVSYGLYIFHFFIPGATMWLCYRFDFMVWERFGMLSYLALNTVVLILLATISWYFFESRINGLKKHFPYISQGQKRFPFAWKVIPYFRLIGRR